jgi:hypothetical protein
MLNNSFFVGDEIIEKEVTLPDGSVHTLHFRKLPAIEFRKFYIAEQSDNEDVQAESVLKLIVASLVDPDGKPALTMKQALKLNAPALSALSDAIITINGVNTDAKKD